MTVRFVTNDRKAIPVNLELGERFSCSKCDASFGRIHALYDHFDAKHKGIVYPCPKCMKHYTRSSLVSKHIQANHATTCHICHVDSVNKMANERHIETSHSVFKCKKCSRIFGTKSHLTFHENRRCQESINVVTDVKNETFKKTVQKPILESQASAKQLKECKICSFKGNKRQRAKHRKTHKRIKCDICEFGTFYSSKFDRHKQKHHQSCQKCPFISKSQKDFDQHFHLETCEICNLVISENNLKIHYEKCIRNYGSSNEFDKPTVYHCNYCDFKTKKKAFLNMHLRNIHKTDKDFGDPSEKLNQETIEVEDLDKSVSCDSTNIKEDLVKIPTPGVEEHLVENEILTILDTLKNSKDVNEVKLTSRNLEVIPIPVKKRMNDDQDLNLSMQEKGKTEKTKDAVNNQLMKNVCPRGTPCKSPKNMRGKIIKRTSHVTPNNPHVDNQDDNQSKESVCPHCEFSTDDEELYQHHQVTDHLLCYICGFTSEYQLFIFRHMKAIHKVLDFDEGEEEIAEKFNKNQATNKAKPTECPLCSDKFESKKALDRHRSKEHKDQSFKCGRCGKRFQCFKFLPHHYHKFHDKNIDSKTIYDESLVI